MSIHMPLNFNKVKQFHLCQLSNAIILILCQWKTKFNCCEVVPQVCHFIVVKILQEWISGLSKSFKNLLCQKYSYYFIQIFRNNGNMTAYQEILFLLNIIVRIKYIFTLLNSKVSLDLVAMKLGQVTTGI